MTIVRSNASYYNYYSSEYGMMLNDFLLAAGHDNWVCTDYSLQMEASWSTSTGRQQKRSVLPRECSSRELPMRMLVMACNLCTKRPNPSTGQLRAVCSVCKVEFNRLGRSVPSLPSDKPELRPIFTVVAFADRYLRPLRLQRHSCHTLVSERPCHAAVDF
jgi:hypothetical protein